MNRLSGSKQTYLQTVLALEERDGRVRNVDIARALGYAKPSVTAAVRHLAEEGLLVTDEGSGIHLTDAGRREAEALKARSDTLTRFFLSIGADPETAGENARRIGSLATDELVRVMEQSLTR